MQLFSVVRQPYVCMLWLLHVDLSKLKVQTASVAGVGDNSVACVGDFRGFSAL